MKNYEKKSLKASNGITLIALVITIIVLLILAGISISMLAGDNGILQQSTNARTRTIHANVLEQMQLEASAYTVDKTTGNYSNSLIDYLKGKSIISDISGEEDKWLINVTTLLGSNQSMGKGTYPNDVYVLEEQGISTGSIINTKVATLTPITILANTSNQKIYTVKYYENTVNNFFTLGNISDSSKEINVNLPTLEELYDEGVYIGEKDNFEYYKYNNNIYRLEHDDDTWDDVIEIKDVSKGFFSLTSLGGLFHDGTNSRFHLINILGGEETILEEYEPTMKIEDLNEEIDLIPYINSGRIELKYSNDDYSMYNNKEAIITLHMNGEVITWSGKISFYHKNSGK